MVGLPKRKAVVNNTVTGAEDPTTTTDAASRSSFVSLGVDPWSQTDQAWLTSTRGSVEESWIRR